MIPDTKLVGKMMLSSKHFTSALASLDLNKKPVIVHASLRSFGSIQDGAETVLQALFSMVDGLMMPAFTYKTMITPEVGPANNGLTYGTQRDLNRMAVSFHLAMPVDPTIGALAETLRHFPGATRSIHPILSFLSVNMNDALSSQTMHNPFGPIGYLADRDGWVLLLGVDHTVNTSIHYGEKLAGHPRFVRWAFTGNRIVECPGFPGCSDGFEAIRADLETISRRVPVGDGFMEAIPLRSLLQVVQTRIKKDPLALLCQREECERCDAVRVTKT